MSDEDRIDEIIKGLSADYNRPPATPRDDMWAAIQAAQKAPGPRLHVAAGGANAQPGRHFGTRYTWIGMAAAAVLLIATGVGIGRYSSKPSASTIREPGVRVLAENPQDNTGSNGEQEIPSAQPTMDSPSGSGTTTAPQPSSKRTREEILRNPRVAGQGKVVPVASPNGNQFAANPVNNDVYNVATAQHLANAEVLLTAFTLKTRNQQMDAQFSQWAKGLLANTRLLLDSPAGDDPRRAKLLQDLEQVLAQIVQLSPNAAATDRELIQGSIQQGQVITRLRTSLPGSER